MANPRKIKRVLIYRLGSLGDTVVALPALHTVARAFPEARRLMLTNFPAHAKAPAASAVLGGSGLVEGYLSYPVGTRSIGELMRLWRKICSFHPDILIYLAKPRGDRAIERDRTFFRLCGISEIIGLPIGDLAESLYLPESGLWERESARLLRSVRALEAGTIEDARNWDLRLSDTERKSAEAALASAIGGPLIVCGPGTKMQAKDWGEENWRLLLKKLSADLPSHALVLVGAKEERAACDYVVGGWRGQSVNLCGQLTPRETSAVLEHAELFLGPDSGPMHLAAAVGVPCAIAFAARTKPGIWYPAGNGHQIVYHQVDCLGCNIETCIEQKKKCLTSITIAEMQTAALSALSNGRKRKTEQIV